MERWMGLDQAFDLEPLYSRDGTPWCAIDGAIAWGVRSKLGHLLVLMLWLFSLSRDHILESCLHNAMLTEFPLLSFRSGRRHRDSGAWLDGDIAPGFPSWRAFMKDLRYENTIVLYSFKRFFRFVNSSLLPLGTSPRDVLEITQVTRQCCQRLIALEPDI